MNISASRNFLFGTLRGRLILSVALVHAVMMTLFIGDLTMRQRLMLLDDQTQEAVSMSQSLAVSAAGWIAANDLSGLQELVDSERRYPEMLFVIITDENGHILAHTDESKLGLYLVDLPKVSQQMVLNKSAALVDVAVPAMLGNRQVGWARVGIGQKLAAQKLTEIILVGILYALAAIFIGSLIAWQMGRIITQRLYTVQDTISEVRRGIRTARSKIVGTDEAASIAREFNTMLDTLDERDQALRQSESKYRLLIQSIHAAIVVHGPDTGILMSNPMAQELLGLAEDQLLGKTAIDPAWHFFREDGTVMPNTEYPVNQVFATYRPLRDFVMGAHRSDQANDVWVLVNADPVFDKEDEIVQVIITFIDITARKQAEEALLRSSEEIYDLYNRAPCGYHSLNSDGVFTQINDTELQWLDYTRDETVGKMRFTDLITGNSLQTFKDNVPLFKERGWVKDLEFEIVRKDGTLLPVLVSGTAIYDDVGNYVMSRSTVYDITKRKQAEEKLQERERHLQSLLRLSKNLERAQTYSEVLNAAQDEVRTVIGYQNLWVYLLSEDKKYFKTFVAGGSESETILSEQGTATLKIEGDRMLEELAETKEIVAIADARTDERTNKEIVESMGICTLINVPIFLFDKRLGIVGTGTFGDEGVHVPTKSEEEYLRALASHMAVTLDRIHLLDQRRQAEEELKQRMDELERFNRVTVGRELHMIELKKEVNELSRRLGQPEPYQLDFVEKIP